MLQQMCWSGVLMQESTPKIPTASTGLGAQTIFKILKNYYRWLAKWQVIEANIEKIQAQHFLSFIKSFSGTIFSELIDLINFKNVNIL